MDSIKVDVFIYRQAIQHCHTEQESHTAQKEGPNHKESLGGMPESVSQPHPRQRSVIAGAAGLSLNAFLSVTQRGHGRNSQNLPRRHGKTEKNHCAGKNGRYNRYRPMEVCLSETFQQISQQQGHDPLRYNTAEEQPSRKRHQQYPSHPVINYPLQLLGGDSDGLQ